MKMKTRNTFALGGAAVGVIALCTIGATSAAFLQSLSASGPLSGKVTVAQGPDADKIYDDPENPNIVVTVGADSEAGVLTTLTNDTLAYPTRTTGGFSLTAGLIDGSADANVRVTADVAAGSPAWVREHLRVGIYVDGEMLNPGGVPLTMDQVDEIGGVDLGVLKASDSAKTIEYRIWLGSNSPAEAYASQITLNATIVGETATGKVFDMNVEV